MAMSKRDYVAIAKAIDYQRQVFAETAQERHVVTSMAAAIASVCAADNPRFDRQRFLDACGLDKT